MSMTSKPPSARTRWARWATAVGLALGLGVTSLAPPDAAADTRARRKPPAATTKRTTRATHATRPARAHGRAEPVTRRRGPLAPPTFEKVSIGQNLRPRDETPGRRATAAAEAADAIDKLLRGPLRHGTTALYVVDADTGRELFSLRPDERLNPASNVKLISTAAALDLLGPDYRYPTRLLGPGPDLEGTVAGDVYLQGSYDPTLGARGLDELAQQVATAGVKRITGDVLVGSTPSRDGVYRARVRIDVVATTPGAPPRVTVEPAYDLVEVKNEAVSSKRAKPKGGLGFATASLTLPDGRRRLIVTVRGAIGKGKRVTRAISIKDRHLHAAHLLRAALRRHGVELGGDVAVRELGDYVDALAAGAHLPVALGEHRSAALADIVTQINKRSINWLADRLIVTAALDGSERAPSMSAGVDAMYAWLDRRAGIRRSDAVIDTGSGLSYKTQLSPRQLVRVLRTAAGLTAHEDDARLTACAQAFTHSLSIGGVDGTLRARFRAGGLRGKVIGKTGTLSNVIALSGLLTGPDGHRLAFSLLTNGHDPSRKRTIRAGHEQLVAILERYLAATTGAAPVPAAEPAATPADVPTLAAASADEPVTDPSVVDEDADDDEAGVSPDDDAP